MHNSIGQNIKSLGESGLRCPPSVDKIQDCDVIYGPITSSFTYGALMTIFLSPALVKHIFTVGQCINGSL